MSHFRTRRNIDEAGIAAVLDAAEHHAAEHGHRVVIALVEQSGELLALRRTPGAQIASSRVAGPLTRARSSATSSTSSCLVHCPPSSSARMYPST